MKKRIIIERNEIGPRWTIARLNGLIIFNKSSSRSIAKGSVNLMNNGANELISSFD